MPGPNAWRYRDYVIRAFNEDKPYDRFVREQIAGDLLPARRRGRGATATWLRRAILAELTRDVRRRPAQDQAGRSMTDRHVGKAFLGLTLGCARCHDHKFDPIPQTDYYGLYGILSSTRSWRSRGRKFTGTPRTSCRWGPMRR